MKNKFLIFIMISSFMISCGNQPKEVKSLDSEIDSVSYAVGLSMSMQLKSNFKNVNEEILLQAIRNNLDSTNLLIEIKDIQNVIRPYFQKKQQAEMKEKQEKAAKEAEAKFGDNKKAGEEFLKANKSKNEVITTASGLQYIVLKEGKGESPKAMSKVKVHYHGTTINGEVFDSSVEKKKPYELGVNQFVKGFGEGLQLMKVGAKYKFFIPQELAYGVQQRGALIKPFTALVFEVELLDILDKK
ncbi:MAG: FKBP-type peptidyl-prolyl cis-trans isomerase [Flavobacteriaceae bacterium]|nr:FKBP-type peptidyl-prolyl cis-trans isomerase [Flavobacteriaceae bacterium]